MISKILSGSGAVSKKDLRIPKEKKQTRQRAQIQSNSNSKNNSSGNYGILRDPVIVASILVLCGAYIILSTFVFTAFTVMTLSIVLGIIYYPLIGIKKKKIKLIVPPTITLFVLMPCLFFIALHNDPDGFLSLSSKLIVTYNYSITLISTLVLLPLALWSKIKPRTLDYNANFVPSISVIVPAHNEEKVIERTIINVLENNYPKKELIVIDNASTDKTSEILKKYQKKIKTSYEPKKGKSFSINNGIKISTGEFIVVLDADTIVTSNSLQNIVQPFYNNKQMGAVTGNVRILNPNNYHTKIQVLEYALASQIAKAAFVTQGAVTVVSGAFGAFRRKVVDECAPFSNDTLTEDLDATIIILKKGYHTTIQNSAIAYTEAPNSLCDLIKQRTRWYRGLFQAYSKHPELLFKANSEYTSSFIYSLIFNSSLIVPLITIVNLAVMVYLTLIGSPLIIQVILLNLIIMGCLFTISLRLNKESLQSMRIFPLAFVYLRIHDFLFIKTMIEQIFNRETKWGNLTRIG